MKGVTVPGDFGSDGCTVWKPLRKILGAKRYRTYCREHDFLRRHKVVHWLKANWILAHRIWRTGIPGKLRSPFYFLGTTLSYPWYNNTQPLHEGWQWYADQYQ